MASRCLLGYTSGTPFVDGASPRLQGALESQHAATLHATLVFGAAALHVRASAANIKPPLALLGAHAFDAFFEQLTSGIEQAFGHGSHRWLFLGG